MGRLVGALRWAVDSRARIPHSGAVLVEEIRKRVVAAMKGKREVERDVLRLALSEIQSAENRAAGPISDEEGHKIVRKLLKSNTETIELTDRPEVKVRLVEENLILESLLPKRLSLDEIISALAAAADEIKAAKSDGQATGTAMKHLKASGLQADGKDVGEAVKKVRSP